MKSENDEKMNLNTENNLFFNPKIIQQSYTINMKTHSKNEIGLELGFRDYGIQKEEATFKIFERIITFYLTSLILLATIEAIYKNTVPSENLSYFEKNKPFFKIGILIFSMILNLASIRKFKKFNFTKEIEESVLILNFLLIILTKLDLNFSNSTSEYNLDVSLIISSIFILTIIFLKVIRKLWFRFALLVFAIFLSRLCIPKVNYQILVYFDCLFSLVGLISFFQIKTLSLRKIQLQFKNKRDTNVNDILFNINLMGVAQISLIGNFINKNGSFDRLLSNSSTVDVLDTNILDNFLGIEKLRNEDEISILIKSKDYCHKEKKSSLNVPFQIYKFSKNSKTKILKYINEYYAKRLRKLQQFMETTNFEKDNQNIDLFHSLHIMVKDLMLDLFSINKEVQNGLKSLKFSLTHELNIKIIYFGFLKLNNSEKRLLYIIFIPIIVENECHIMVQVADQNDKLKLKRMKDINKNQDNTLHTVAHELRTPLNGIISMLELLSINLDPLLIDKFLRPALNSSKSLLSLINDILDRAQILEGKLRIVNKKFFLGKIINEAIEIINFQAIKRGLVVKSNIGNMVAQHKIISDPNRVRQILLNLLGNSLKFTFKGSITIKAEFTEDHILKISVQDTGIGIKDEDQERLFEKFVKIDYGDKDINSMGVGLGLLISSSLVKSLGPPGSKGFEFESKFGVGTEFSFYLKDYSSEQTGINKENFHDSSIDQETERNYIQSKRIKISKNQCKKKESLNKPAPSRLSIDEPSASISRDRISGASNEQSKNYCQCPKILIVDDNEMNLIVMESLLENLNICSKSCKTGEQSIEEILTRLEENKCCPFYDIIYLDGSLPFKSGAQIACEISELIERNVIQECTIIGCTADPTIFANQIKAFIVSDALEKPITIESLHSSIKKWCPNLLSNK